MRLVWLAVNASYSHSSLALPLLHAAAGSVPGVDWHAVRGTENEDPIDLADRVSAAAPDVLAASVFLFTRRTVLDTVARVKALHPDTVAILGGPEFLGDNERFLKTTPSVDFVLRGEGEQSFARWLEVHASPAGWPGIPGLCWVDNEGDYRDNGLAEAALEALPLPEGSSLFDWRGPFVQLETSRGCPNRCSFCTSCLFPPRTFAWDRVVSELDLLRRRDVREVRVLDRTFNIPPARAVKLLRFFREECPDIRFHLEIHPAFITDAFRAELDNARPGQLHLEIGLQSGTPHVLKALERCPDSERTWATVEHLCRADHLETHVDLLTGLPGQTLEDLFADVARLTELGPDEIQLETLKLLPGTPLRRRARKTGIAFSPVPPYDVLATPTMPREDLAQARLLSQFIDRFYNQPQLHGAVRAAVTQRRSFLRDELSAYADSGHATAPTSLRNRFRYLHQRLRKGKCREAGEELELAWIRHGFSPEHGLSEATCWPGTPPADARLIEGAPPEKDSTKRRVWHIEQTECEYWFVYRGRGPAQKPLAIYARNKTDSRRPTAGQNSR